MDVHKPVQVSLLPLPARSLLSTMCTRHVITTATSETVEVGCLVAKLAGVPIYPRTRIFMWKAYPFPVRCRDSHFVHEDISHRCKTGCAANLILYRSYELSRGLHWESRSLQRKTWQWELRCNLKIPWESSWSKFHRNVNSIFIAFAFLPTVLFKKD